MKTKTNFNPADILSKASNRKSSLNPFLSSDNSVQHQTIDIPIDQIITENNPRKTFNEASIRELAESISQYGLLQPIVVRKKAGKYELINGERRYRAHKLLKSKTIPAVVKNVEQIDITKLPEIKLVENLQREDLSESDLALSLQELKNRHKETNEQLAKRINKSAQWVKTKIAHAEILKETSLNANVDKSHPIYQIPTSLFTEIAPLDVSNRKKAIDYLIKGLEKKGDFPSRNDLREYVRPLKPTKQSKAKPKLKQLELKDLKSKLAKIKEKISVLQNEKAILEETIRKYKK
ncbi:chromosome partitioning protein ParB [Leptospira levettii]|uniref:ParB/RepB/Spo0J family partition protein n=1 Tax=Leptospira levettii TaxID=2023178 RepID=UPI000C2B25E9|nr:ParB/RepB/Spo0J family partition protein [Leptospira levettii]MCW7475483.1 ParB/RepB/Spo0J family partition protein [Leptospira levettii]PJZ35637.1 chromosome partitioning protein ParB [Leptospira levettii]PJZ88745.1 chromosome partitioning protein ParB [Leptospira levettii]PKA00733.1 chromosome partitioning protein ParB [Leptospira levettii]TGM33933.1 ParB/RepB/Spo0J family partition protein [Leptospira levettii]